MRTKFLCENCGSNNYKPLTSPLSFKYGSTVLFPCFKCNNCGERYIAIPTKINTIVEQLFCIISPFVFSFMFFEKFSPAYGTLLYKLGNLRIVMLTLPLYGVLITVWNYIKSFMGVFPFSFTLVHIDRNYNVIEYINEHSSYNVIVTALSKSVSKIKEGAVYKCLINNNCCAIKLLSYEINNNILQLVVKTINIKEIADCSEIIILDIKSREICRGKIYKIIQ